MYTKVDDYTCRWSGNGNECWSLVADDIKGKTLAADGYAVRRTEDIAYLAQMEHHLTGRRQNTLYNTALRNVQRRSFWFGGLWASDKRNLNRALRSDTQSCPYRAQFVKPTFAMPTTVKMWETYVTHDFWTEFALDSYDVALAVPELYARKAYNRELMLKAYDAFCDKDWLYGMRFEALHALADEGNVLRVALAESRYIGFGRSSGTSGIIVTTADNTSTYDTNSPSVKGISTSGSEGGSIYSAETIWDSSRSVYVMTETRQPTSLVAKIDLSSWAPPADGNRVYLYIEGHVRYMLPGQGSYTERTYGVWGEMTSETDRRWTIDVVPLLAKVKQQVGWDDSLIGQTYTRSRGNPYITIGSVEPRCVFSRLKPKYDMH